MKSCPRCASQMVQEPDQTPFSRSLVWACLLCGETIEQADPTESRMTPEQLEDLERRPRRGRPRKHERLNQ